MMEFLHFLIQTAILIPALQAGMVIPFSVGYGHAVGSSAPTLTVKRGPAARNL